MDVAFLFGKPKNATEEEGTKGKNLAIVNFKLELTGKERYHGRPVHIRQEGKEEGEIQ